jgi:GT2 family glycosyltransferase
MLLSTDFLYPAIYRRQALLNRPCVEKYRIPLNSDDLWAFNLHLSEVDGLRITHLDEVCCELNSGKPAGGEDLRRALQKHLRCKGLEKVRVNKTPKGHIHASWDPKPGKVSIIIPNKDHFRDITRLVKKLKEYDLDDQLEVIIVDNGSWFLKTGNAVRLVIKRGVEKYFEKHGVLVVHYDEPFNYSRANNLGAGLASGEYLLFMNNDMTIPEPGWLNELVQWASLPEVGITSGKLLYPNGRIQAFGTVLGMHGLAGHVFRGLPDDSGTLYGHTMWYREASAVTGACMLMRREVFHSAGGFNEDYQLAFSDVEFCLQVRALGYQIVCNPYARLTHYEGKSRSDFVPYKDLHLGLQRMGFEIETGDPLYPSKMSLLNTRPSVKPNYEPTPLEVIFSNMASRSDKPG